MPDTRSNRGRKKPRTRRKPTGARGKQGLAVAPSPKAERRAKGGPGEQPPHQWPGHEDRLRPPADHGEKSYRGADKLKGRRALITGGDSGIGKAVAIAFAREGADVAIAYFDEHDDARDTVAWIQKAGRSALAIPGDLRSPGHCRTTGLAC